ncbi:MULTISPECIES: NADH oxidase [unclassified Streptomyces]|uniref:NADH oxidase n=1 Tax=unclassified Streptomyces TaxID=2593676 RepID=UPI00382B2D60
MREALSRMELGPVLLSNVEPDPDSPDGRAALCLVLLPALERLSHLVVRTLGLTSPRGPLLSVCPVSRTALFSPRGLSATSLVRLPQGVSLALEGQEFSLGRDGAQHRVLLHRPEAVWVVAVLAWPVTPQAVSQVLPLPEQVTRAVLEYLAAAGMLVQVGAGEEPGASGPSPEGFRHRL